MITVAPRYIVSRRDGGQTNVTRFLLICGLPDFGLGWTWTTRRDHARQLPLVAACQLAAIWNAGRPDIRARVEDAILPRPVTGDAA